jgi:hypothetical protein
MKQLEITTEEDQIAEMPKINRVVIIDQEGRKYVNMEAKHVAVSIQDEGQTLKVFLI